MFTSRGPRNREEIADCVSFFKHSPHWSPTDLTELDMVECWEALLLSGHAHIEIIENPQLAQELKNRRKAVLNPHFLHGYVHVEFVCFVTFEFLKELVGRESDLCDPVIFFLERYQQYRSGLPVKRPIAETDKEGRLRDASISTLACGVFHSDISCQLSMRTLKYVSQRDAFANRIYASVVQDYIGFKHDVALNSAAGRHFIVPLEQAGLKLIREYSRNSVRPFYAKKYLFASVQDVSTAAALGVPHIRSISEASEFTRYTFMHLGNSVCRKAGLTRLQQCVCVLLLTGYSFKQIARAIDQNEYDMLVGEIAALSEKRARGSLESREQKLLDKYSKSLLNIVNKVKDAKRQAVEKLFKANLFTPPFEEERLVGMLKQNSVVAHEVREYLFPVYPWPEDLDSRRG